MSQQRIIGGIVTAIGLGLTWLLDIGSSDGGGPFLSAHPALYGLLAVAGFGLVAAGLVALILSAPQPGPTSPFTGTDFGNEVRTQLKAIADERFLELLTDTRFLRDNVPAGKLQEAARCTRDALLPVSTPAAVGGLMKTIEDLQGSALLYREDCRVMIDYCHLPSIGEETLARITTSLRFRILNYSGGHQSMPQRIEENAEILEQIAPGKLFEVTEFVIEGADRLAELGLVSSEEFGKLIYRGQVTIDVPSTDEGEGGVQISRKARLIQRQYRPYVLTFFNPVYRCSVTVRHPEDMIPELYLFGIDAGDLQTDPMPPTETLGQVHRWQHDGWFMANQGFVVTFSRARQPASDKRPE